MNFHPHLHIILLGGGLTPKNHWKDNGYKFFLPIKVVSKVFRGKYLEELKNSGKKINFSFMVLLKNIVIAIHLKNFLITAILWNGFLIARKRSMVPNQLSTILGNIHTGLQSVIIGFSEWMKIQSLFL